MNETIKNSPDTPVIIREEPKKTPLQDGTVTFGEAEEITSRQIGAEKTNLAKITLWGPDILHKHALAEETYVCTVGTGELFLGDQIV